MNIDTDARIKQLDEFAEKIIFEDNYDELQDTKINLFVFIKYAFGENSVYLKKLDQIKIPETENESTASAKKKLSRAAMTMLRLIDTMIADVRIAHKMGLFEKKGTKDSKPRSNKVFIVHGTDHEPVKELKVILEESGLKPKILHEQPSGSMTIIEKLEKCSHDVSFAFVLLTPDDALVPTIRGHKVDNKKGEIAPIFSFHNQPVFRARQNVLLEFGYFIAKIGRDRVVCLFKENTELPFDRPSDMHGVVYTPFKESVFEVNAMILKELEQAGYSIRK